DGVNLKNVFEGLKWVLIFPDQEKPVVYSEPVKEQDLIDKFNLKEQVSVFDEMAKNYPTQYTTQQGIPKVKWDDVTTVLDDLDTTELHYVQLPINHIFIDLDITNDEGEKDL